MRLPKHIEENGVMKSISGYENTLYSFFEGLKSDLNKHSFSYKTKFVNFFENLSFKMKLFRQFKKQADRYLSSDFNIFDTINPDENKLSDIIGNILNINGTHGQDRLFLNEFIDFLKRKDLKIPTDNYDYKVFREVSANGRIDILLESDSFALIIENKPFALDQKDQINRYYEAMKVKHNNNLAVLHLNKNKELPKNFSDPMKKMQLENLLKVNKLVVVSYFELIEYLTFCYQKCESEKFRYFLNDFIEYISKNFKMAEEENNINEQT
jgi:hypothetical protein